MDDRTVGAPVSDGIDLRIVVFSPRAGSHRRESTPVYVERTVIPRFASFVTAQVSSRAG